MISKESLSSEWFERVSAKKRKADKILIEKVIRALLLLEGLVKADVDFIFKGGTALMLLTGSSKRLSIDIDIVVSEPVELDKKFQSFLEEQEFSGFELQKRKANSNIKKAHYKFFYTPAHQYGLAQDHVLLDILFEKSNYSNIVSYPIDSIFFIPTGSPLMVKIPSYEDILGDKLTAFAPNTTGIPYEKNGDSRSMEIIKQLYDIGSLLEYTKDVNVISKTFFRFAETELGYRNCDPDTASVLKDIYETSLHICSRGTEGNGNFPALMKGITQVKRFIFSESYHIDRAIIDASKAAYIAKVIEHKTNGLQKFTDPMETRDLIIDQAFNSKLNKLKKSNPEAFFYWYQIYMLEKEKDLLN